MAVVVSNSHGFLIDSLSCINENYDCALARDDCCQHEFQFRFKHNFFQILHPHISSKIQSQNVEDIVLAEKLKFRKRRKRKQDLNQGEVDSLAYHDKIRRLVEEGSQSLVGAARFLGYLVDSEDAGEDTQTVFTPECPLAAMCDMAKTLPLVEEWRTSHNVEIEEHAQAIGEDTNPLQGICREMDPSQVICESMASPQVVCRDVELDLFSRMTAHHCDGCCEVTLLGRRYLIPPRCHFLLSDISRTQPLLHSGVKYDLIVLDPPWENKSVKRSSRYNSLPSSQLKQLPVNFISAPECLVVTWVTNRPKHLRFVKEELYPHWGVTLLAEWIWVKVTRAGEFVFPLDSPHKKPYEVLMLGRIGPDDPNLASGGQSELPEIPYRQLIVSVPSTLHSHKPPLSDVLKAYIKPKARCLEMFARSLRSDWTSWGNQVLTFQHTSYFTKTTLPEAQTPSPTHS